MPKLVFFLGPAGAGKSTLAEAMVRRNPAAYLDMDTLLRPAAEAVMTLLGQDPEDRDSPVYKSHCRDLGYRLTMNAALEQVRLGLDAFVIGPFTRETEDPGWLQGELSRIGASTEDVKVKVVLVHLASSSLYRERIMRRGSALDRWKLDHWDRFNASLSERPIRWPLPDGAVLRFDNSGPLSEEKLAAVARHLQA